MALRFLETLFFWPSVDTDRYFGNQQSILIKAMQFFHFIDTSIGKLLLNWLSTETISVERWNFAIFNYFRDQYWLSASLTISVDTSAADSRFCKDRIINS